MIVRRADRRIRNNQLGVVRLLGHLHAALNLANGVEIVADDVAVLHAEAGLQALRLSLHAIQDAAGFRKDLGAFLIGVALSEELLEDRARVAFLRQRLGRRAPGDAGAALTDAEFERRETRVLSHVADGDLVGAHAGVRTGLAEVPGLHGGQPALLDVGVGLGRFRGLVAQAGDDGQMLAERLQRLQDRRHGEVRAGFLRRPAIHDRAVREADKGKALRGLPGGSVRHRGCGGNHGFQERQCDGGSDSLQDCAAWNVFLGYEHGVVSFIYSYFYLLALCTGSGCGTRRILNWSLLTTA